MSKERWLTGTYLVQLRGCINTSKNKMEHHPAQPPQVKITASESEKHTCYSSPFHLMKMHLLVIIKNTAWYHFLFLYILRRWEEKQKRLPSGHSQTNVIFRQDAWAWKQGDAADTHGNSTKRPCLQTVAGQLGTVTSLLTALTSSAKISHCKRTVMRMK